MSKHSRWLNMVRVRPRLGFSTLAGASSLLLLPRTLPLPSRSLIAWDIGVGLFLVLVWTLMFRSSHDSMEKRSREQDEGALIILALTLVAAVASIGAIVLELLGLKNAGTEAKAMHVALATLTIVLSWMFVHTNFALHYAHAYFARRRGNAHCLIFPDQDLRPTYPDFLYFSFIIGATSQTADVSIASPSLRRLAMLHGVTAFFFNTTLLAVAVNIAAGLV